MWNIRDQCPDHNSKLEVRAAQLNSTLLFPAQILKKTVAVQLFSKNDAKPSSVGNTINKVRELLTMPETFSEVLFFFKEADAAAAAASSSIFLYIPQIINANHIIILKTLVCFVTFQKKNPCSKTGHL